MLSDMEVLSSPDQNFWTKTAYRIPADPCACVSPGTRLATTVPIGEMTVRSFITNLHDGSVVKAGTPTSIKGIAFDQGRGIDHGVPVTIFLRAFRMGTYHPPWRHTR